jgi:hypothetical protein
MSSPTFILKNFFPIALIATACHFIPLVDVAESATILQANSIYDKARKKGLFARVSGAVPGSNVNATFPLIGGGTTTLTGVAGVDGVVIFFAPLNYNYNQTINFVADNGDTGTLEIPPPPCVTVTGLINSGSFLNLNGDIFNTSGSFVQEETSYDSDFNSPTFGTQTLSISPSQFNVVGTNTTLGTISFVPTLTNLTVDLAPALNGASSTTFSFPISGTLNYNSSVGNFSGTMTGVTTYGPGFNEESTLYTLNFTSDFGPITGTINTTDIVEPCVPEPGVTLGLLSLGLLGLLGRKSPRKIHKKRLA